MAAWRSSTTILARGWRFMQLLNTPIRTDWQSRAYPLAAVGAAYWHMLRIVVPIGVVLSTGPVLLRGRAYTWLLSALLLALLAGLTWQTLYRLSFYRAKTALFGGVLVVIAALITWLTFPPTANFPRSPWLRPGWPVFLVALAPLASGAALWLSRYSRADNVIRPQTTWATYLARLLIGTFAGLALHLHLMLVVLTLQPWRLLVLPKNELVIWFILAQGAFFAVIEEFALRGPAFAWQYDAARGRMLLIAGRQALLGVIIRLPTYVVVPVPIVICLVSYRVALGVINVLLRQRCKSMLPGLAGNALYSVLTSFWLLNA